MARPAVVVALPKGESGPVLSELADAGFEALEVASPGDLEAVLAKRADVGVAILDGETDFDESLEYYSVLHDGGRTIPTLMVVSLALVRPAGHGREGGRRGRVPDPPLLRRVDPLADRGDVHPQPDRRRRQRADPPERADDARGLEPAGHDRGRVQPEGRRRQDDDRDEPGRDPADPSRPARPAGRRRHGHGPRLHLAGHRRGADRLRQLAGRGRGRQPRDADRDRGRAPLRDAGRVARRTRRWRSRSSTRSGSPRRSRRRGRPTT